MKPTNSRQTGCALRFSLILALLAAAVSPSLALGGADQRDFDEAMRLCALGHYSAAAKILREVQRKHPNDVFVLTELGTAYLNDYNDVAGGVDKAQKCFHRAIQMDPEFGKAYCRLAECYDAQGDFNTGIKLATKALTVKKTEYDALRERAGAYSNLKRDKEALVDIEEFLKKVAKIERKHLVQRATILENLKQYDRALSEYRKILQDKYEDQVVYREVACLQALHRTEEAIRTLDTLIKHNRQDDSGYLTRARLFESLGKHKEAVADYSKAFELQPSTNALKERAAVFDKMGRKDLAERDRREADRL